MTPRRPTFARRALRLAALLLLPYLVLMGLLAGCQRHLIYFPQTATETAQRTRAAATGLAPWVDAEGRTIGWRGTVPPGRTRPAARLLVVHGNAGSAVNRGYFVQGFESVGDGTGWEVSILEYPGFGARPGKPDETTLMDAAREAVLQLQREDERPIHVLGESLGSGVACGLAAAFPDVVRGLVLITPFTRLPDVGAHHYPWLPVRLIMRDRYDNVAALQRYRGPVAIVVAGRDEVVPAELGRRLLDAYTGPKRLWEQPAAGHNSLNYRPDAPWWKEVSEFIIQTKPAADPRALRGSPGGK
jgi:pimeloyl-ACP methyl ester carboxylesterase